jgi:hypothetical protein
LLGSAEGRTLGLIGAGTVPLGVGAGVVGDTTLGVANGVNGGTTAGTIGPPTGGTAPWKIQG